MIYGNGTDFTLSSSQDDERKTKSTMQRLAENIAAFDRQIEAERVKMERDVDAERAPILAKIDEIKDQVMKLSLEANRCNHSAEDDGELRLKLLAELRDLNDKIEVASTTVEKCQGRINSINMAKKNPLTAFGDRIPNLVAIINRTNGWIKKPVGPIGMFIKLKIPNYGRALESVFGETLNGFIVETDQDKALLYRICKEAGITKGVPIIKQQRDPGFDCSSGEPDRSILTIRRALDVSSSFHYFLGALIFSPSSWLTSSSLLNLVY